MSISEPFTRRPIATTLLTIGLILLGLVSYRQLGVAALPNVDFPVIFMQASLPGASPETMAAAVATPLERRLGAIAGVNELTSVSSVGSTVIIIQFELGRAVEDYARDVQAAINAAAPSLPKDLPRLPTYFKANPSSLPIVTLALTSDTLPASAVYDYADTVVSQKLSQIDGVAQVNISGAEASAVRVQVNPRAAANMGLALDDIRSAIQKATVDGPKGSLDGGTQSWVIAADDQLHKADEYRQLIVAWRNGAPVRLGDVAKVTDSVANDRVAGWFDTKHAVVVQVRKQADANMAETVDRVRAALPQLKRWIPPSIDIQITADRAVTIREAIADIQVTMLLTTFLVIMVIAMFLRRFWATLIPSVTIPVAIAGTFTAMFLYGFTLDNMSLMALMISIGFVVDDAIVMIENIVRLIESGVPPLQAALSGAKQMTFTVISITVSLLAALVPMMFMPGFGGLFFREFSVTLAVSIVISAVVSLTLTPMMCGHLLSRRNVGADDTRFARTMERGLAWVTDRYARSLETALRFRWSMIALTIGITFGTIYLYIIIPKGTMPTQDTGVIRATTDAPPDISFAAMRDRQLAVAQAILTDPAVDSLTSSVGSSSGIGSSMNNGSLTINLKPMSERHIRIEQVIDRLRPKLARIIGIDTYLVPVQDFGFGARSGKARYQYSVRGAVDLATLQKWTEILRAKLSTLPELTDIASDQDASGLQANLSIDRVSAGRLGVSPSIIDQTLYDAFGQRQIATIYTDLDQFKVVMEVDPADSESPEAISRLYLPGAAQVPLAAVVKTTPDLAPVTLNHDSQQPAITIGFDTKDGVSIDTAMQVITKAVSEIHLPDNITADFAGDALESRDANHDMLVVLLSAIVGMYLVLGMLYESYAHPLTILSTIPSAGLGALLSLMAMHMEFSLVSTIGIILLIGIVKKNAILMVDFALVAEREAGLTPREAIIRAARLRFRPITMTTLAAMLGALPTAIGMGVGSELRQPLGVTLIGGLVVSQAVTLYTTPVVYLAVNRMRSWRLFRRLRWLTRVWRWRPAAS